MDMFCIVMCWCELYVSSCNSLNCALRTYSTVVERIFCGLDMLQYAIAMHQDRPRYVIDRPAYNLPDFDREFDKKSRQFPVGEKAKKLFRYRIYNLSAQST